MCTKNYDQMMYRSWDMVHDGSNYFSFWDIFCPFILLTAWKIKIKKKKKTPGDIIILHVCTKNHDQMMYGFWDMGHDRCNYFSFYAIFYLLPFTFLNLHHFITKNLIQIMIFSQTFSKKTLKKKMIVTQHFQKNRSKKVSRSND